jgi:hypothetical protein
LGWRGHHDTWHTPDNALLSLVSENKLWNVTWGNPSTISSPLLLEQVWPFYAAPGVGH